MTIFLSRHGQSEGNIDRAAYNQRGDIEISQTLTGCKQKIRAGRFFETYLEENGFTDWPRLWVSPLLRSQQSLKCFLRGMKNTKLAGEMRIFEDSNAAEQDYGWLRYLKPDPADPDFAGFTQEEIERGARLFRIFADKAYRHGAFTARPPGGEAPIDAEGRIINLINSIRRDIVDEGVEHHVVEMHGAGIKLLLKRAFHLPMSAWDKIKTPGNGDIFRIDLDPVTHRLQGVRQIYDGQAGRAVDLNPLAGLKPLSYADLAANRRFPR